MIRKRRIFVGVGLALFGIAVVGLSVAVFFPQRLPSRGARIFRWGTAPQASSQCWALLIGVDDYAEAEKLRYCGADMRDLRDQLIAVGFPEKQVILLDNKAAESKYQPQKSNIERQLELVLDAVEPEDLLVLAFSGHGAHMDGKSYLCPADARLDDSGTMISADAVYSRLEKSRAAMKLLLVDACRNDPRRVGGRSIKTVDNNARQFAAGLESAAQAPERPRGILLLTSCAPGQISMEDSDFGHGVFMHYLLEGLRGKADAEGRGYVSMIRLYDYTKRETKAYVLRKYNSLQTPALTAKDLVDFDFGSGWSGPTGQTPAATVARIEPQLPQTRPEPETRPTASTTPRPQPSSAPPLAIAPFDEDAARQHQEAWARHLGQSREITNSIGMKLVLIPAGEFMMGSWESADELVQAFENYGKPSASLFKNEHPYHRVRITKPLYLGAYEVTVGQFGQFVGDSNYKTGAEKDGKGGWGLGADWKSWEQKPEYTWRNTGLTQTDGHPVVNVSWNDAVAFCEWLSHKEGKTYRLPTEAEWEYACRAGTTTRYYCGDDPETLAQVGNVADATVKAKSSNWTPTIKASDGYVFTAPTGQFRPNVFGLYDMHGNVGEWCADWYDSSYYTQSSADDPTGPSFGADRVLRGGSWTCHPHFDRSAVRLRSAPDIQHLTLGFRLARTP